jgi:glycosyltransferase involved in cell wall biosynthesis
MTAARVLYVVDGLGLSGKTKAMVDLVLGLDRGRYTPTVACFDTEQSPLYERLRAADVPVEVIPCPDGLNLQTPLRLAGLMRRLGPQVVHCYNPRTMLYAAGPARALRIRATLGTLSAFACLTPDMDFRFLPQRLFSVSRKNRVRNALVSRLVRALVAVSPSLGERFCRFNHVDLGRLRVIGYGVDLDRFTGVPAEDVAAFRARHGVPPGAVLVSSVGRLVEQKDYPTQLRAFALAARRVGPAADLRMLLAGDGPLRGELEALASTLGIAERVRFVGHTSEIPLVLRASDVFVLASKFEPYGVALLEAKAAGAAILATRVNEIPEIVVDGEHGTLVPPEDPAAMGEALATLARDGELRRRLGRRAAQDAAARHSLRTAIDGYQELYDEIREAHS